MNSLIRTLSQRDREESAAFRLVSICTSFVEPRYKPAPKLREVEVVISGEYVPMRTYSPEKVNTAKPAEPHVFSGGSL